MINEKEVIEIIIDHISSQFPKTCPNCQKSYATVKQWVLETTHVGDPISYDAEENDWTPLHPLGTNSLANCCCGTTLAVGSHGMKRLTLWRLLFWARLETMKRGVTTSGLLAELRSKINKTILQEESPEE